MAFDRPIIISSLSYIAVPNPRFVAGKVLLSSETQLEWGVKQSYDFKVWISDIMNDEPYFAEVARKNNISISDIYGDFVAIDHASAPYWGLDIRLNSEAFSELKYAVSSVGLGFAEIGIDLRLGDFSQDFPKHREALVEGQPLLEIRYGGNS